MQKNTVIYVGTAIILVIASIAAYIAFGSQKAIAPKPAKNTPSQESTSSTISEAEARAIAEQSCIKGGEAIAQGSYNPNSRTWWFDANLNMTRPGCFPACVVSEQTKTASINWRCTGAIPPQ